MMLLILAIIINIFITAIIIIFLNKKNNENLEKIILNQINENNLQNFEESKRKFDEIEKSINLGTKNSLLEGTNSMEYFCQKIMKNFF